MGDADYGGNDSDSEIVTDTTATDHECASRVRMVYPNAIGAIRDQYDGMCYALTKGTDVDDDVDYHSCFFKGQ